MRRGPNTSATIEALRGLGGVTSSASVTPIPGPLLRILNAPCRAASSHTATIASGAANVVSSYQRHYHSSSSSSPRRHDKNRASLLSPQRSHHESSADHPQRHRSTSQNNSTNSGGGRAGGGGGGISTGGSAASRFRKKGTPTPEIIETQTALRSSSSNSAHQSPATAANGSSNLKNNSRSLPNDDAPLSCGFGRSGEGTASHAPVNKDGSIEDAPAPSGRSRFVVPSQGMKSPSDAKAPTPKPEPLDGAAPIAAPSKKAVPPEVASALLRTVAPTAPIGDLLTAIAALRQHHKQSQQRTEVAAHALHLLSGYFAHATAPRLTLAPLEAALEDRRQRQEAAAAATATRRDTTAATSSLSEAGDGGLLAGEAANEPPQSAHASSNGPAWLPPDAPMPVVLCATPLAVQAAEAPLLHLSAWSPLVQTALSATAAAQAAKTLRNEGGASAAGVSAGPVTAVCPSVLATWLPLSTLQAGHRAHHHPQQGEKIVSQPSQPQGDGLTTDGSLPLPALAAEAILRAVGDLGPLGAAKLLNHVAHFLSAVLDAHALSSAWRRLRIPRTNTLPADATETVLPVRPLQTPPGPAELRDGGADPSDWGEYSQHSAGDSTGASDGVEPAVPRLVAQIVRMHERAALNAIQSPSATAKKAAARQDLSSESIAAGSAEDESEAVLASAAARRPEYHHAAIALLWINLLTKYLCLQQGRLDAVCVSLAMLALANPVAVRPPSLTTVILPCLVAPFARANGDGARQWRASKRQGEGDGKMNSSHPNGGGGNAPREHSKLEVAAVVSASLKLIAAHPHVVTCAAAAGSTATDSSKREEAVADVDVAPQTAAAALRMAPASCGLPEVQCLYSAWSPLRHLAQWAKHAFIPHTALFLAGTAVEVLPVLQLLATAGSLDNLLRRELLGSMLSETLLGTSQPSQQHQQQGRQGSSTVLRDGLIDLVGDHLLAVWAAGPSPTGALSLGLDAVVTPQSGASGSGAPPPKVLDRADTLQRLVMPLLHTALVERAGPAFEAAVLPFHARRMHDIALHKPSASAPPPDAASGSAEGQEGEGEAAEGGEAAASRPPPPRVPWTAESFAAYVTAIRRRTACVALLGSYLMMPDTVARLEPPALTGLVRMLRLWTAELLTMLEEARNSGCVTSPIETRRALAALTPDLTAGSTRASGALPAVLLLGHLQSGVCPARSTALLAILHDAVAGMLGEVPGASDTATLPTELLDGQAAEDPATSSDQTSSDVDALLADDVLGDVGGAFDDPIEGGTSSVPSCPPVPSYTPFRSMGSMTREMFPTFAQTTALAELMLMRLPPRRPDPHSSSSSPPADHGETLPGGPTALQEAVDAMRLFVDTHTAERQSAADSEGEAVAQTAPPTADPLEDIALPEAAAAGAADDGSSPAAAFAAEPTHSATPASTLNASEEGDAPTTPESESEDPATTSPEPVTAAEATPVERLEEIRVRVAELVRAVCGTALGAVPPVPPAALNEALAAIRNASRYKGPPGVDADGEMGKAIAAVGRRLGSCCTADFIASVVEISTGDDGATADADEAAALDVQSHVASAGGGRLPETAAVRALGAAVHAMIAGIYTLSLHHPKGFATAHSTWKATEPASPSSTATTAASADGAAEGPAKAQPQAASVSQQSAESIARLLQSLPPAAVPVEVPLMAHALRMITPSEAARLLVGRAEHLHLRQAAALQTTPADFSTATHEGADDTAPSPVALALAVRQSEDLRPPQAAASVKPILLKKEAKPPREAPADATIAEAATDGVLLTNWNTLLDACGRLAFELRNAALGPATDPAAVAYRILAETAVDLTAVKGRIRRLLAMRHAARAALQHEAEQEEHDTDTATGEKAHPTATGEKDMHATKASTEDDDDDEALTTVLRCDTNLRHAVRCAVLDEAHGIGIAPGRKPDRPLCGSSAYVMVHLLSAHASNEWHRAREARLLGEGGFGLSAEAVAAEAAKMVQVGTGLEAQEASADSTGDTSDDPLHASEATIAAIATMNLHTVLPTAALDRSTLLAAGSPTLLALGGSALSLLACERQDLASAACHKAALAARALQAACDRLLLWTASYAHHLGTSLDTADSTARFLSARDEDPKGKASPSASATLRLPHTYGLLPAGADAVALEGVLRPAAEAISGRQQATVMTFKRCAHGLALLRAQGVAVDPGMTLVAAANRLFSERRVQVSSGPYDFAVACSLHPSTLFGIPMVLGLLKGEAHAPSAMQHILRAVTIAAAHDLVSAQHRAVIVDLARTTLAPGTPSSLRCTALRALAAADCAQSNVFAHIAALVALEMTALPMVQLSDLLACAPQIDGAGAAFAAALRAEILRRLDAGLLPWVALRPLLPLLAAGFIGDRSMWRAIVACCPEQDRHREAEPALFAALGHAACHEAVLLSSATGHATV